MCDQGCVGASIMACSVRPCPPPLSRRRRQTFYPTENITCMAGGAALTMPIDAFIQWPQRISRPQQVQAAHRACTVSGGGALRAWKAGPAQNHPRITLRNGNSRWPSSQVHCADCIPLVSFRPHAPRRVTACRPFLAGCLSLRLNGHTAPRSRHKSSGKLNPKALVVKHPGRALP